MSDRTNRKLDRAFDKVLTRELKKLGEQTLDISRTLVPISSGNLRDSSKIQHVKKGWTIIYDTPYASDIEEGRPGGPANYTMNIKRHKRRLASGRTTTVTAHKKEYKNYQRPVSTNTNEWRILTVKAMEGVHFLTDAWARVRKGVRDKSLRNALPVRLSKQMIEE